MKAASSPRSGAGSARLRRRSGGRFRAPRDAIAWRTVSNATSPRPRARSRRGTAPAWVSAILLAGALPAGFARATPQDAAGGARAPPPPSGAPAASAGGSGGRAGHGTAPSVAASATAPVPWAGPAVGDTREGLDPFPSTGHYLSYGVAFHSESLLATGNVCPDFASEQCILGAGGGISFAGAYRAPLHSLGAAYEASFHDSNNIYQRGVLQQLRGEWRLRPRWLVISESINPFFGAGGGVASYGDNWSIATIGAAGHATIGTEFDLGVKLAAVFAISYRAIYFRAFEDPSRQYRPAGLVHLLGLQLGLELHDPL